METQINQHLGNIEYMIRSHHNELVAINGGLPGIIIFYFHLHETTQEVRYYNTAIEYLETLYDRLEHTMPKTYVHSSGLAGLGWFFNYIQRFIEIEHPFDSLEYDATFMKAARKELSIRNYEFFTGFSGIILYLLTKKSTNTSLLADFIDDVYEAIFSLEEPISFFRLADPHHKYPSINLGVSHGIYGFVAVLNKLHARQIQPKKCEALLRLLIDFTMNHKKDYITHGHFFSNRIGKGIKESRNARLAWCYGDLGILTVLHTSSEILKDTQLRETVEAMLINTTHRKDMDTTMMNDVWLCHGTGGAAHIFQRLYEKTEIADFKFAADYWYRKTLGQLNKGWPQIKPSFTRSGGYARKDVTGFLIGYAGLGLSLLSRVEHSNMDWDELILMS
ncbi:MAG: lanthionine synthetase LanC family protein [Bacteroidota bacterium]